VSGEQCLGSAGLDLVAAPVHHRALVTFRRRTTAAFVHHRPGQVAPVQEGDRLAIEAFAIIAVGDEAAAAEKIDGGIAARPVIARHRHEVQRPSRRGTGSD
jgi:hypothetical protein